MGAWTVNLREGRPNIKFEYQIPTKYNASAISFQAETSDAPIGYDWSIAETFQTLPYIMKGEVVNDTRIDISVTYYITEQQDNIVTYARVGSDKFQLLVRDIVDHDDWLGVT